MLSDYFSEINDHGTVVPVKDLAAFPRSEQAVLGAKNLALANRAITQTISDTVFTVDADDVNVVSANGITSAEAWFNYMDIILSEGDYKGNGCVGGSDTTYMLSFVIRNAGNTADETTIKCFDGDVNITVPSGGRHVRAFIVVRNGKTLTNQLFKLMIRPATDPDPTYAPFAMTNKELTEIANNSYANDLIGYIKTAVIKSANTTADQISAIESFIGSDTNYSVRNFVTANNSGQTNGTGMLYKYSNSYAGFFYTSYLTDKLIIGRLYDGTWSTREV